MRALFLAALVLGACDDSKDDTQGGGDEADADADADTDADADADTDCTPADICQQAGPQGEACEVAPFTLQPKQCASWFQNDKRCTNGKMSDLIDCECGCMEPKGGKAGGPGPLCACMQQCMADICGGGGGGNGGGN
jgi:hypothetical protein